MIECCHVYIQHCGPAFSVRKNCITIFTCTVEAIFHCDEDYILECFRRGTGETDILAECAIRSFYRYLKSRLCLIMVKP